MVVDVSATRCIPKDQEAQPASSPGAMMGGLLWEVAMAIYISLIKFTDTGIKNIKESPKELCRNLGDGVDQAAWLTGISMTSTPF
jgi:hypothetical protein